MAVGSMEALLAVGREEEAMRVMGVGAVVLVVTVVVVAVVAVVAVMVGVVETEQEVTVVVVELQD